MITTKRLIACWAALGIATALAFTVHDTSVKEAEEAGKQQYPYVELTNAQVIRMKYEECLKDQRRQAQMASYGSSCEQFYSNPIPEVIADAQNDYRRAVAIKAYESSQPDIKRLNSNQEIFSCATGAAAILVFLLWFKSTLLPRLVAVKDAVRERAPSTSDLKAIGANRKVRQAESDFQTLKNLHDNGLINDEMFEKRKAELKEALSANKVFQD